MTVGRSSTPYIPKKSYFAVTEHTLRGELTKFGVDEATAKGLATALHRIFNRMGADERLNYDIIERNLGGAPNEIASWHTPANITVASLSDIYEVLVGGNTIELVANLSAALTGDTDIDFLVNGVVAGTVTVASGDTRGINTIVQTVAPGSPGDQFTLEVTAVGTGTATASFQARVY